MTILPWLAGGAVAGYAMGRGRRVALLPPWLRRGKVVEDIWDRSEDADAILEDDEFAWTWIEVMLPIDALPQIGPDYYATLTKEDLAAERARNLAIRQWMMEVGAPSAALHESPVLVAWDGERLTLLDGGHRLMVAKELGATTTTALVGIEP